MAFKAIQEMLVQPQGIGEVFLSARDLNGPASYLGGAGNGQIISANMFALLSLAFVAAEGLDSTETYFVYLIQGAGRTKTFRVRWYVLATGAEVANATNLSASKIRYMAIGN